MSDKMDSGKMAQAVHDRNVARRDGGPGSGKKKGGGGMSESTSEWVKKNLARKQNEYAKKARRENAKIKSNEATKGSSFSLLNKPIKL